MLVNEDTDARLVGYLSADPNQPGFVVPLFNRRNSNMYLVQEVGFDGRVESFREVEPRAFNPIVDGAPEFQSIGKPAIWGFRDASGTASFADRQTLKDRLVILLKGIEQPFLKLQVAQFCEDEAEMVSAWQRAFDHLAERSPRSANAWRDVVVIPAQMRLAVEQAILAHGLDASVERLGRTVEVDVDGSTLRLRLDESLYTAIAANSAARTTLEQSTGPVREAFGLMPGELSLISKESRSHDSTLIASEWGGVSVLAIGRMAISLARYVTPLYQEIRRRRIELEVSTNSENQVVLFQLGEEATISTYSIFDALVTLRNSDNILFVIFQVAHNKRDLLDAAISFAKQNRNPSRHVIAVIPHLPTELAQHPSDPHSTSAEFSEIAKYFDSVWTLGDRSPNVRASLAYGPLRSESAVAAHFSDLLDLIRSRRGEGEAFLRAFHASELSVIGSAVGFNSIAGLVNRAMMQLSHHLIDFSSVASVRLLSSRIEPGSELTIRKIIRADAPNAQIEVSSVPARDGGPARVSLALSGVRLFAGGTQHFETFCLAQLERYGWEVTRGTSEDGTAIVYHRGVQAAVPCKFAIGELTVPRAGRLPPEDTILLTNMAIRRRAFALHVLNGQVPIYYSRIEAMHRIYRRRFSYVLTYLNQKRKHASALLTPAALNFINFRGLSSASLTRHAFGRAKLSKDDTAQVDLSSNRVHLFLPLYFGGGRGEDAASTPGSAIVELAQDGWSLQSLQYSGREIFNSNEQRGR